MGPPGSSIGGRDERFHGDTGRVARTPPDARLTAPKKGGIGRRQGGWGRGLGRTVQELFGGSRPNPRHRAAEELDCLGVCPGFQLATALESLRRQTVPAPAGFEDVARDEPEHREQIRVAGYLVRELSRSGRTERVKRPGGQPRKLLPEQVERFLELDRKQAALR